MPEKKMFHVFEKYDGTTDLDEHLRSFVEAMTFYSLNDLVWCRVFSLSLKGEAFAWFHSLPLNTPDCFNTLRNLFGQQYASSRVQSLTYLTLMKIKQRKDETLKDFMDRYNKTVRQVKVVEFVLSSLITALRIGPFTNSLFSQPPKTIGELQERATEFIRIEEMRAF